MWLTLEYHMKVRALMLTASLLACGPLNAQWDSIVGESSVIEGFDRYWVTVRSGNTVYLVDTKNGEVAGTIATSRFSPAVAPHPESGRIFSYGSFYTRDIRGERTDLVMSWDLATLTPGEEVEIPARASAIGGTASGLMGMMQRRFVGVWNISPASSVSVVDTEDMSFVGEISLPSCSGVNPLADGWLSVCGDGTAHYVALDENGQEAGRIRSEPFFDQTVDPIYDYSVPAGDGWMFMSFEGLLRKVTLEGDEIVVSEAFDINPQNDGIADVNGFVPPNDDHFRIGGLQVFAWHDEEALLFTLMHAGGGQHTFEQAGTELWAFNMRTGNRGYRLELGDGVTARSVFVTPGPEPLLLVAATDGLQVREPRSGRLIRTLDWVPGQTIQALYEGWSFEDLADD
jgi:methylamine dehydrogenase heavy chain